MNLETCISVPGPVALKFYCRGKNLVYFPAPFPRRPPNPEQKRGAGKGSPSGRWGVLVPSLEINLQSELQAAHRRAKGQTRNVAGTAAVNAAIGAIEVNVVEEVVSVKLELRLKPFSNAKGFEHREVRVPEFRSAEGVAPDVSEGFHCRLGPRSDSLARRIKLYATGGLKPIARSLGVSGSRSILHGADNVGSARTGIA